jgi:ATP-dependent Clp protease ATP-binding subunit ClpB
LSLDDKARTWLGEHGYDPVYGARPLKRVIQRALENPLALAVLDGRVGDGSTVEVSAGEDGLLINGQKAKAAA